MLHRMHHVTRELRDRAAPTTQGQSVVARLMATSLVIALIGITSLVIAASPASAYTGLTYCDNSMAPGGTCPPNGVNGGVKEGHIVEGQGNAGGESHETCIDTFLEYEGGRAYSLPECMYYAGETARDEGYGRLGIVRAWNGGSVTHTVWGWEYYF